jgi:hypothetical protein
VKTQIIQLEPHDDVISTRDKMGWGKAGRILLVWPERGQVLSRSLDLVLLQRHSATLGVQLALVTTDPQVHQEAAALGIPVFKKLRQARAAVWRAPRAVRRSQAWRSAQLREGRSFVPPADLRAEHPATAPRSWPLVARIVIFVAAILALLVVAGVLLPGARVTLTPTTRTQEVTIQVRADPNARRVNLTGVIPARPLSASVAGSDQIELSGNIAVPYQPAIGRLVFTNLTDQSVEIPAGAVVRNLSDPVVRFATTQAGTLSPGPGTQITLTATAQVPGASGNLPTGSLKAIEGALGLQLTAHNPAPTHGGVDLQSAAPTQGDYQELSQRLSESLRQSALKDMQSQLPTGDLLFEGTLEQKRTLEETFQPPDIQPANTLHLNQRLEFQALSASGKDLLDLGQGALNANLPEGYLPVPASLEVQPITAPVVGSDGIVHWKVRATQKLQPRLSSSQVTRLVHGLPPGEAARRLTSSLSLASPPQISLWPSWWLRMPFLPFRIQVVSLS